MLLTWLLIFSAAQTPLQLQAVTTGTPTVKHCPDGSTIRSSDTCAVLPDHRYLLDHEPLRQETRRRWWCGRSLRPTEVSITIEQRQPATATGAMIYVTSLGIVLIQGRPAPPAIIRTIREKIASVQGLYDISGRCLSVRSRGAEPILLLHHSHDGQRGAVEVELM